MKKKTKTILSNNYKHGKSHTPIWQIWQSMKSRCLNHNSNVYKYYGGREIKICKKWLQFENFYKDMGEKPKGKTLDRINNNGNYEPNNCKWRTIKEQCNNRRSCKFLTFKKVTMTMKQWAEKIGISHKLLWARINIEKWPLEKALTQKPRFQHFGKWRQV